MLSGNRYGARPAIAVDEFGDRFYRGAETLNRQAVEEQTASFGKALAKQIIRGEE
jgi:hypothetical protein